MVREGLVQVAFDCREHWTQLEALALRYGDRNPDLANLCLVRLSELHPRLSVITVDHADFKIYRRNKREAIPLICPPRQKVALPTVGSSTAQAGQRRLDHNTHLP